MYLGNSNVENLNARIDEVLERLHLEKYRKHHPMSLSGGQRQRIAVALAIMSKALR